MATDGLRTGSRDGRKPRKLQTATDGLRTGSRNGRSVVIMRVRRGIDCIDLRMLDSVGRKSPIYICI
jgi:hypothetical protein